MMARQLSGASVARLSAVGVDDAAVAASTSMRTAVSSWSSSGWSLSESSRSCGTGGGRCMGMCDGGRLWGARFDVNETRGHKSLVGMRRLVYAPAAPGLLGVGRWSCCGHTQSGGATE